MRLYIYFWFLLEKTKLFTWSHESDRKLLTGWKCSKDVSLLFVVMLPFFFLLLLTRCLSHQAQGELRSTC